MGSGVGVGWDQGWGGDEGGCSRCSNALILPALTQAHKGDVDYGTFFQC